MFWWCNTRLALFSHLALLWSRVEDGSWLAFFSGEPPSGSLEALRVLAPASMGMFSVPVQPSFSSFALLHAVVAVSGEVFTLVS